MRTEIEGIELTSKSYLEFTTECATEVKEISERIESLNLEFDDMNRTIKTSREQIKELKRKIRKTKKRKREISKELEQNRRELKVDIQFLNKLNNSMTHNNGGAHLVEYQKRRVR